MSQTIRKDRAMNTLGLAAVLLLTGAAALGDEVYRPSQDEAFQPWTYCNWNRHALPPAYEKICADRDIKKAHVGFRGVRLDHLTSAAMRAPSRALPRRCALCMNWKKPR